MLETLRIYFFLLPLNIGQNGAYIPPTFWKSLPVTPYSELKALFGSDECVLFVTFWLIQAWVKYNNILV